MLSSDNKSKQVGVEVTISAESDPKANLFLGGVLFSLVWEMYLKILSKITLAPDLTL